MGLDGDVRDTLLANLQDAVTPNEVLRDTAASRRCKEPTLFIVDANLCLYNWLGRLYNTARTFARQMHKFAQHARSFNLFRGIDHAIVVADKRQYVPSQKGEEQKARDRKASSFVWDTSRALGPDDTFGTDRACFRNKDFVDAFWKAVDAAYDSDDHESRNSLFRTCEGMTVTWDLPHGSVAVDGSLNHVARTARTANTCGEADVAIVYWLRRYSAKRAVCASFDSDMFAVIMIDYVHRFFLARASRSNMGFASLITTKAVPEVFLLYNQHSDRLFAFNFLRALKTIHGNTLSRFGHDLRASDVATFVVFLSLPHTDFSRKKVGRYSNQQLFETAFRNIGKFRIVEFVSQAPCFQIRLIGERLRRIVTGITSVAILDDELDRLVHRLQWVLGYWTNLRDVARST